MDATFDVNFLTPIRGHDEKGQDFEMTAMLAGRGKLVVFFERDGIVDRKEKQGRNFELERRDGRGTGGNLHLGVPAHADQGSRGGLRKPIEPFLAAHEPESNRRRTSTSRRVKY